MRVLVGCEFSGVVRRAFEKRGHEAWSCDLLEAEDNARNHFVGDVLDVINKNEFDLIILHPPCTALAVSGNRWYGKGMPRNKERRKAQAWTQFLWQEAKSRCERVALENPVGVLNGVIGDATQYIQPWQYGHGETKKTGLWLHNLPPLTPTNEVDGREQKVWKCPPSVDRWKIRSRTYQGIAEAMAEQWREMRK
jgi:site-specific DNA-cytosine methylase